ncbi:MFS transporter [Pedomonas mirosovicensis]|uniref:MFS transporter n=1 Tax=Pedomonas mirosovicensis TaxID=2908641 RepID=UPI0021699BF0|nr:MFS transporter [Pedomonas mirosovicensis]MCH8686757.1 MFS transporter [Pedomonas mirosovicensis]
MAEPPYKLLEPLPKWTPEERPVIPGSPAKLEHSPRVRAAYICTAVLVGITGGLGNALVTANLPTIQGELGLTPVEGAWLPAAYIMVTVSANLLVFKFRQQFGIRLFAEIGLTLYAILTLLHVVVRDYPMALFVRAASGLAGAPMTSLGLLYAIQAFKKKDIGRAIVVGFGISQLATPLAWVLSPALLDLGEWNALYVFESGLAFLSLAAVVVLKLPRGMRIQVFEPLDFLTFLLAAPALALIGAVLAQGRVEWWSDQPWMAWAIIAAIVLLSAAFLIEHHRRNPLIQTRWLGTLPMARFTLGALTIRFLLAEQTFGAVGMLRTLGMGPDQLQSLYAVILAGILVGLVTSATTFSREAIVPQILVSVALICIASFIDATATSLDRPQQFFFSQFLMAIAGGLFFGPMLLAGFNRALQQGPNYIVTFVVLFSITQNLGGLAGPALLNTFQQFREHEYSSEITADINPTNPVVAGRLQLQGQIYGRVMTDPVRRQAQGTAQLGQIATREANVLAYNDVFLLTGAMAMAYLAWSLIFVVGRARRARAEAQASAGPGQGPALQGNPR